MEKEIARSIYGLKPENIKIISKSGNFITFYYETEILKEFGICTFSKNGKVKDINFFVSPLFFTNVTEKL